MASIILGRDTDATNLASDALAQALALARDGILGGDAVRTFEAGCGALASFIAISLDPEKGGTEELAARVAKIVHDYVVRALQATRGEGVFRPEILAAARTMALGLPVSRKLRDELSATTLLNPDGTVDPEGLKLLEELHERLNKDRQSKTGAT